MLIILLILSLSVAISPHSINTNRNKAILTGSWIEYEFSLTESGLYPLDSDNASLFYWYLPTLSPLARSAPLLLWLGDGRVSVMKDVFGEEGPFSITIQQHTLEQIHRVSELLDIQEENTSEFLFPNTECGMNYKVNMRKQRQLDEDDEEEELSGEELLAHYSHCHGHHSYHPHCRTTTTTRRPTTTTATLATTTTTATTTSSPITTTTTQTTTIPPNTGTTPRSPPPPSITTPRPPITAAGTTPQPPFGVDVHSRQIRGTLHDKLKQLLTNIPVSLNAHSLLSSYSILYVDSMAGYATGRPSDNILTAVTSLINSTGNRNVTLVASLHMLETLRARNPTELNSFLSLPQTSLELLQTETDEDIECLMSACTLRQLSECPRMMALYYWLNGEEGTVRERLGIKGMSTSNKNGWIPYDKQLKQYSSQSL